MTDWMDVKDIYQVAVAEDEEKIDTWALIHHVNESLKKAGIKARFEISQQNIYCHNKRGEGTLITFTVYGVATDKEVV